MKDKRILITGGTGVLGTYIVETLLADGFVNIEVFSRSGVHDKLSFKSSPYVKFTKGNVVELHPLSQSIEEADYIINAAAIVSFDPKKFDKMHPVYMYSYVRTYTYCRREEDDAKLHVVFLQLQHKIRIQK